MMETLTKEKLQLLAEKIFSLNENSSAQWGILTPQHMTEHLIVSMKISNGKFRAEQKISEEEIPLRKKILMSDQPLPKGIINPVLGEGLRPLKFPDLATAKEKFLQEITDFYKYYSEYPDAAPVHPLFGPLSKPEWEQFHTKHITHHFSQFGLL